MYIQAISFYFDQYIYSLFTFLPLGASVFHEALHILFNFNMFNVTSIFSHTFDKIQKQVYNNHLIAAFRSDFERFKGLHYTSLSIHQTFWKKEKLKT